MTKIKICGITCAQDVEYLNEYIPEYAGFVMFFSKSKRNITPEQAKKLLCLLDSNIKSVAVTVSPDLQQIETAKECGFDYVQIHGEISDDVIINSPLPVFRAFNVNDINKLDKYRHMDNIVGYIFDAHTPGSGKTFDWSIIKNIPLDGKIFILAGGLNCDNAADAVSAVHPDVLDVSSGVENTEGVGKDKEKIKCFVNTVRRISNI